MLIDENDFFRQAALKICGSLDLDNALRQCFQYLRHYMPADTLCLVIYRIGEGIVQSVAGITLDDAVQLKKKIPYPSDARKLLNEIYDSPNEFPFVRMVDNPLEDRLLGPIVRGIGTDERPSLHLRLRLEGKVIGAFMLIAARGRRFTEEHAGLIGLLNEPVAIALNNYLEHQEVLQLKGRLVEENKYLRKELRGSLGGLVGADGGLADVIEMAAKVASMASPVLLMGETGTGKELVANAIHAMSPRKDGPFIKVNCGAIPEGTIDSELFGHERGAFTGAIAQKCGKFERAHRGTIFLDEIGELPQSAQIRLLRVLQEKEIERVGGSETLKVDIRVIAATHRNLEKMIADGRFREDLHFRLKVFPIQIPPLRERVGDIPALVRHFIQKKSRDVGLAVVPQLADGAMEGLTAYDWPGNVRELENAVERALILCGGKPLAFLDVPTPARTTRPAPDSLDLEDVVAQHIRRVLEMTHGKINGAGGAAEVLNINPSTLRQRMRKLAIPFGRKAGKTTAVA